MLALSRIEIRQKKRRYCQWENSFIPHIHKIYKEKLKKKNSKIENEKKAIAENKQKVKIKRFAWEFNLLEIYVLKQK